MDHCKCLSTVVPFADYAILTLKKAPYKVQTDHLSTLLGAYHIPTP
jgi:hypothetical protein